MKEYKMNIEKYEEPLKNYGGGLCPTFSPPCPGDSGLCGVVLEWGAH